LKTHGSGGHAAEARQRLAALEEKARRDAEEKAWTDASAIGTVEAITRYLKDHASSAHAAQARQQLAALEEQARKDEEKAWADALSAGTIGAIVKYLKDHASSDYAGEARQRLAALEEQARKQNERLLQQKALRVGIPPINIRNTCRAASVVARDTTPGTDEACIKTELSARDSIVEQWSGFIATEKAMCINRNVYLPSYVEWLTCLELHRDVRKMRQQPVQALEKRQPRKRR
jgi:hypothetical protein